jgi:hypothetical protein
MSRRRSRRRLTVPSVLVALALVVGGYALHAGWLGAGPSADADPAAPVSSATPTTDADPADASTASRPTANETSADATEALLATLPVKGSAPATGYDREGDFGSPWLDVDHNGCDTRDDVLARDLTAVVRDGACTVERGTLRSPYTGQDIAFVRGVGTSNLVQIDHVVALEDAWRTGAQQLTQAQREALANDPLNLFAVDQHSNEQKRSGDAATWLPASKPFRCSYVAHQVAVKAKYHLWVVPAERDAIERVLTCCP